MSNRFISNLVLLKAMALEKDGAKEVLISISQTLICPVCFVEWGHLLIYLPLDPLLSPDPTDHPRPYSLRDFTLDSREPAEALRLGVTRLRLCFGRFTEDAVWTVDWGGREDRREDWAQTCNCPDQRVKSHLWQGRSVEGEGRQSLSHLYIVPSPCAPKPAQSHLPSVYTLPPALFHPPDYPGGWATRLSPP